MNKRPKISSDVEKGFSRYIQTCLFHTSREFFRKVDRDAQYLQPMGEDIDNFQLMVYSYSLSPTVLVEIQDYLGSVIRALSPMEKKLITLKYFEGKTDSEIACLFGLTQQAVSKAKRSLLDKLRHQLEL
ncbi:sigma-70 family RNA polymerase sigma factor [Paenibacillus sp. FSL R7-0048]|uniref:sigma-70 family RNA polymerase sigma factor n=1 Tax=Paenibacillus TaxID=44249 RepID=UPI00096D6984|nr:sigma-70 family RNA polymerase sigma factor [Paenibacillus odorifer]OMD70170.1 hypothetical protein BSK48_16210 [Paenibacillus odorifer]OMD83634.1 hypothetical protein BSK53_12665 [Paenibacillus odorifer]